MQWAGFVTINQIHNVEIKDFLSHTLLLLHDLHDSAFRTTSTSFPQNLYTLATNRDNRKVMARDCSDAVKRGRSPTYYINQRASGKPRTISSYP
jgi:hypothetical protein